MTKEAYFRRDGDRFLPLPPTRGFWSEDSMHGRALVGLLGHEIEARHGGGGMIPARLTVDLHRLAPRQPVEITTTVLRDGGRLRLVEAVMLIGGVEHARALCQFVRPSEAPPGKVWPGAAPWQVPLPDTLPAEPQRDTRLTAEWRLIEGAMGVYGPRRVWMREGITAIEDEPLTAFSQVAIASDFGSPWVHSGDEGVFYINTDVTLQLHRLPVGEWLGLDATAHDASQGIAVGQCRIYDQTGSIGFVSITALGNRPRQGTRSTAEP